MIINLIKEDNKMGRDKLLEIIMVIVLIIIYVAADLIMDKTLFPILTESLKEQHLEIVARYKIFFNLVWVWMVGYICSSYILERNKNKLVKLAIIIFGSALVATVVFAFTSLPLIWTAYKFPLLSSTCLFLHDYGLLVYFVLMIPILGYKYFKKLNDE